MKQHNVNEFWLEYDQMKDRFYSDIAKMLEGKEMNDIIGTSFKDPANTTKALLFLKMHSATSTDNLIRQYLAKIINTALNGSITNIVLARQLLLEADRTYLNLFLNQHLEDIIADGIISDDEEWVYRRLLELTSILLFNDCKDRVKEICKHSLNAELRKLVDEF